MNTPISICTAGWPIRGKRDHEEILLGTKAATPKAVKRGIAGKLMPYGGDMEPEDNGSPVAGFTRELFQESGDNESRLSVDPKDVEVVAKIEIRNLEKPSLILYLLFAWNCKGNAKSTREIINPRYYPTRPLPENLLESDKLVLPRLLAGEKLEGWILYSGDMKLLEHHLKNVESIQ